MKITVTCHLHDIRLIFPRKTGRKVLLNGCLFFGDVQECPYLCSTEK